MKDYRLLLCIVRRDQYESYLNMFKSIGIEAQFASLCNGTASKSLLDYMGLEKNGKGTAADIRAFTLCKKDIKKACRCHGN